MRRAFTFAIVASWVMMVALLVHKHEAPPSTDLAALPGVALDERDEWFGVYHDRQKVGHAHRVTARTETGYSFFEDSVVALAMLGVPQTLRTSLAAETDASFALTRFHFVLTSPATVFSASGTSDGQRLTVRYGAERERDELDVPLSEPIYLPSTLRPRVLAGTHAPGTRYTVPVLNPLTLRNEPMTVVIEGEETVEGPEGPVATIRLAEEHQGLRTRAWLDQGGAVIREEATLGFTLEREPRARALAGDTAHAPVDLAMQSRIPLAGRIDDPRHSARLTLRVRGDAAARIPDAPPRQHVTADLLRVAREELPAALPFPPPRVTGLDAYTAPAPFIESDDPAVVAMARSIVAGAPDTTAAARRLVSWVSTHLEKTPSVTVPSAREVLTARRGDCNEHAVLLTALARAAGIPARVVAGAVYAGDGFYYHAWTELWLGDWVSADGVFAQIPADATHVKLVDGGTERQIALADVIGKLEFAVEAD